MSKKIKTYSLEAFEKDMEDFRKTSFWAYFRNCDQENVERKIKTNIWYPIIRFFENIKYWFVYRFDPRHRYHVVKTDLCPGYYDIDYRMFACCFSLLVEFVEKECDGIHKFFYWENTTAKKEGISQKELNSLKKKDKAVRDLYFWYTVDRVNRLDPYTNTENHDYISAFDVSRKYDEEDQQMLIRLIKIRQCLWT